MNTSIIAVNTVVKWNDPEHGLTSGVFKIFRAPELEDDETVEEAADELMYDLIGDAQEEVQALHTELSLVSPEEAAKFEAQLYKANGGELCRKCLGSNIEGSNLKVESATVTQEMFCIDCAHEWNDVFDLRV